jgi:hypothetical protein
MMEEAGEKEPLSFEHASALSSPGGRELAIPIARSTRQGSETAELILLFGLIGALAWCPLWLGSTQLPAWGTNAMLFSGLAAAYEILVLTSRAGHAVAATHLRLPAILFGIVILYISFQAASWTPAFLHHPIWPMASQALDVPIKGSISVDRDLTQLALLRLLTAAAAFWLALQLCRDVRRADILLQAVALICAAYALWGLIDIGITPARPHDPRYVRATFINRNTFATYVGIGLVCSFGLIWRRLEERAGEGGSAAAEILAFMEALAGRSALWFACAVVQVVALLLTASRGGILAALCGLCALIMVRAQARDTSQSRRLWRIAAIGGLMLVPLALMFGGIFAGKLAAVGGFYDPGRLSAYKITLESISDSPLLGYGFGTFIDIFPMFRDRSISVWGIWDRADNTYLEIFQGLGLIIGSCLIACTALLVSRCFRGATMRRRDSSFSRIAMSAGLLVGVHSLTDFGIQVQAVELTFCALLGMGVAQSASSRQALGD